MDEVAGSIPVAPTTLFLASSAGADEQRAKSGGQSVGEALCLDCVASQHRLTGLPTYRPLPLSPICLPRRSLARLLQNSENPVIVVAASLWDALVAA